MTPEREAELRVASANCYGDVPVALLDDALAEIDRLRAEVERLENYIKVSEIWGQNVKAERDTALAALTPARTEDRR